MISVVPKLALNTVSKKLEQKSDSKLSAEFAKIDSANAYRHNDINKLPSVNVVFRRLSLAYDEGIEKKLNS